MSTSVLDWYHRYLDALGGCQGHHPLAERLGSFVPRPRRLAEIVGIGLLAIQARGEVFGLDAAAVRRITWGKVPAVDIADTEKAYEISAELPGLDEKNVELKFSDGMLTIKGEKKEEKEEKKKDYDLSERRYGSFQRSFTVPDGVDADKIDATFKDGVLTVTLPKTPEAQRKEKQIAIKKG
jgi:HSP20 family protein